jgi:uncharacterized protein with HEPN domain
MRLSEEIKGKHPEVDWRGLAGFRNVLAHGYLGVDAHRVWELIETRLAALKIGMEHIHAELIAKDGRAGESGRSMSSTSTAGTSPNLRMG